jgi:branched-chain amino acid transport system ATP-binding protein
LFDDLTVRENLLVGAKRTRWWHVLLDLVLPGRGTPTEVIQDAVELFGLSGYLDDLSRELPLGIRKLVAVGRALTTQPRYLLLDEPAAGLDTSESSELGKKIRQICDQGIGVLLVDHDMGLILGYSDYVYVMEFGAVIAEGPPDKVREDEQVISAYLGRGSESQGRTDSAGAEEGASIPTF